MQKQMYPAITNSPMTELASSIDSLQTTIEVVEGAKLPDAPNIATIGVGEDAETVLYGQKNGNTLTDVTRAFQGIAKSWAQGVAVARMFTAYDYDTLRENMIDVNTAVNDLKTLPQKIGELENLTTEEKSNLVDAVNEIRQALATHSAEKATENELGHVKGKTNSSGNLLAESVPIIDSVGNFTATDVEGALQEVFQFGNSRKIELVDLLLSLDDSLPIDHSSTWEDILNVAGQISTGRKSLKGAVMSSSYDGSFYTSGGSTDTAPFVTVNGLDFQPTTIVIYISSALYVVNSISIEDDVGGLSSGYYTGYRRTKAGSHGYYQLRGQAEILQDGFVLPVNNTSVLYNWIAFE